MLKTCCAVLALLLAACASASALDSAAPLWMYSYPWNQSFVPLNVSNGIAIAGGQSGIIALNARSGKVLWRRRSVQFDALRDGDTVYAAGGNGTVVAIDARSGATHWRSKGLCPKMQYPPQPSVLYVDARGVYAACQMRISRLRRTDGAVLKSATPMLVDSYRRIEPAGANALALSGTSDGATLLNFVALVRPDTLAPIMKQRADTTFLGVQAGEAVFDDWCCNGRPDVYDPATIFHVSLASGAASPPLDLRPDPQLFPADNRPIGQGAAAALVDGHLYLAVVPMLYDYGYALMPAGDPKRLLDSLTDIPSFSNGRIYARLKQKAGGIVDEIVDVRGGGFRVLWRHSEYAAAGMPRYGDPHSASGVTALTQFSRSGHETIFVRLSDGAQIDAGTSCDGPFASDGKSVLIECAVARPNVPRHLEMFTFPQ